VSQNDSSSDSVVLRLTLATLVAFLLAGIGFLISANSQIPVVINPPAPQQLPNVPVQPPEQQPEQQAADYTLARAVLKQDPVVHGRARHIKPIRSNTMLKTALVRHEKSARRYPAMPQPMSQSSQVRTPTAPISASTLLIEPVHSSATLVTTTAQPTIASGRALSPNMASSSDTFITKPVSSVEPVLHSAPSVHTPLAGAVRGLTPEQLMHNALVVLRGMPDYHPSETQYEVAAANINERIETQQIRINVNSFLSSQRISNDSQLAELQMHPFFAEFDRSKFSETGNTLGNPRQEHLSYAGVGFPHIENNNRSAENQYVRV